MTCLKISVSLHLHLLPLNSFHSKMPRSTNHYAELFKTGFPHSACFRSLLSLHFPFTPFEDWYFLPQYTIKSPSNSWSAGRWGISCGQVKRGEEGRASESERGRGNEWNYTYTRWVTGILLALFIVEATGKRDM